MQNWENLKGRLQPVTYADDIEKKQMQLQLSAGNMISKQTAFSPFGISYRDEVKRMLEEQEYMMEQQKHFQEEMEQKDELQSMVQAGAQGQAQPGQPGGMPPQAGGAPGGMPPQAGGQPQPGGQPGQQAQPGDPNAQGAGQGGMAPGGPPNIAAMMPSGPGNNVTPEDMMAQAQQIATQLLGMPYELRRSQLNQIKKSNETMHSLVIAQMDKIRQQAQTTGGFQALQQMVGAGAGQ